MLRLALSAPRSPWRTFAFGVVVAVAFGASGGAGAEERTVTIDTRHANVVSYWNDIANRTVLATSAVNITAEEKRPSYHVDLATVHVAIYDAVSAIDGRYEPFAVRPAAPSAGASIDAAASAAAYGVLRALFPDRSALYQAAYDSQIGPEIPRRTAHGRLHCRP